MHLWSAVSWHHSAPLRCSQGLLGSLSAFCLHGHSFSDASSLSSIMAPSSQIQSGQEEPLKRVGKIVASLMARPDAAPFLEPVDWRGLELWDYPSVVKRLMDLGTIRRKLERNQYETAAQCAADVRQVWKNCMTYNKEHSDFWLLAKALSKRFEDRYRKIKAECE